MYNKHVHTYTDDSTTASSSGGAVEIPTRGITPANQAVSRQHVYGAEAVALPGALEYI